MNTSTSSTARLLGLALAIMVIAPIAHATAKQDPAKVINFCGGPMGLSYMKLASGLKTAVEGL